MLNQSAKLFSIRKFGPAPRIWDLHHSSAVQLFVFMESERRNNQECHLMFSRFQLWALQWDHGETPLLETIEHLLGPPACSAAVAAHGREYRTVAQGSLLCLGLCGSLVLLAAWSRALPALCSWLAASPSLPQLLARMQPDGGR